MDPLVYKLLWIFGWTTVFLIVWFVRGARTQRRLDTKRRACGKVAKGKQAVQSDGKRVACVGRPEIVSPARTVE